MDAEAEAVVGANRGPGRAGGASSLVADIAIAMDLACIPRDRVLGCMPNSGREEEEGVEEEVEEEEEVAGWLRGAGASSVAAPAV